MCSSPRRQYEEFSNASGGGAVAFRLYSRGAADKGNPSYRACHRNYDSNDSSNDSGNNSGYDGDYCREHRSAHGSSYCRTDSSPYDGCSHNSSTYNSTAHDSTAHNSSPHNGGFCPAGELCHL